MQISDSASKDYLYLYFSALILLASILLFGDVMRAYALIKRGQFEKASKMLSQVIFPSLLIKRNRSYYYMCSGIVQLEEKKFDEARSNLQKSLEIGRLLKRDQLLARLNLAHAFFASKNYEATQKCIEEYESLSSKDLRIKQGFEELKSALSRLS